MGKILDYNNFNAPPLENDRFFFCDYTADNANPVTKQLLISDLNRKRYVKAADTDGLKLLDKDNVYGIKIYDGGNIGVGPGAATTPTSYLDVRGASDASLTLAQFLNPLALTDGRTTQILVGTDRANYKSLALRYTYDTTNDDGLITLRHFEDATEGIHIKGDGNVGINTLTPEYKLDVYSGDIRVRDGSYGVVLDASQAAIKGIAWSAPHWVDGALQIQPDAGGDVYIMYDSGVPAFKVESSNKHVAVGPITDAIADAKLHVLEATSGTLPALKLQNSVASSRAIIELSANSSEVKRYIMSDTSGVVGIRNTNAALGSGSVNFSEGRLNVNATTFGRRFRVDGSTAAADIFIGSFNSSNTTGTKIELRNSSTVAAARPTNLIWFGNMSGTAGAEKVNWMAGAFRNTSVDFFGIHYDSSDFSADNVAFNTTLSSNKFYIDTDGGTHAHGYFNVNTDVASPFHANGDYCRGRFLQTFHVPLLADNDGYVFPAFGGVNADQTNGYQDTSAKTPTADFTSKAPYAGRLHKVDIAAFNPVGEFGAPVTPIFYFYSGSSLPSADGDAGMGYVNSSNVSLGTQTEDTSFTVTKGYAAFTDATTGGGTDTLTFSAGDYLSIVIDPDTVSGFFFANVALTFEFEID